jgi:hypothetical protein
MLKAKKSSSQNYEIRNIEYNPDNHVYGFKNIKNFNFKIMGIKNLKMCSKSGYHQVLLRLKRTNKKGKTGFKTNTWMKGACNRWVLLDTSGIQFLRSAYFNDLHEGVHKFTSEKKSQFLCDFVTGNPILAGILGVIIDDPKTHFAALKLKKQGKSSYSYEVRNINVLGTRNGRNQEYMFVNSSQYKRTNGNFHIGSPFIFNIETIEAVTDDIKTGLCRVLLTFNRIGGGSQWGDCPRYLLLDREGIKFMRWLLIKQALEGHYILDEPSLVTKQREKIQIWTNKGRMAATHKSNKPLEALVFDPRLQAVLLLVLDARKNLNKDQLEKNNDILKKEAAYKIIVEEQTARLKKWESTVADACANQNLDKSIKKLLALDIENDISGLGCLGRSRSNSWSLSTSIGCFQDLDAAASFKKRNRLPGKTSTSQPSPPAYSAPVSPAKTVGQVAGYSASPPAYSELSAPPPPAATSNTRSSPSNSVIFAPHRIMVRSGAGNVMQRPNMQPTPKPAVESNIAWKCKCGVIKKCKERPTVCGGLDGKCPGQQWSKTFGRLRCRLASRRRLENRPIHRLLREIRRAQA